MELSVGMYVRLNNTLYDTVVILKIFEIYEESILTENNGSIYQGEYGKDEIIKASFNPIDLIEYMDLLVLKNPIKVYGTDETIGLFNPVRCDGFTEFDDRAHCIILNLDYIVDIKDLKIKSILTHEQFDSMKYNLESEVN